MDKGLIMMIIGLLAFSTFPLTALSEEQQDIDGRFSTKDEVIYGKLSATGQIHTMYVVNTMHITEAGNIVDYGDYTNIKNLTDLSVIDQVGKNEVHFHANKGEFYYQGELTNKILPWDISINYLLDGKKMSIDDLPGQTGTLDIQIVTKQNKNIDPLFFENYVMQISVKLDPAIFSNIQAPKGTEANEGKNKLITFSVMPETEEELIITADVEHLEMNPINITAIPVNIAIENPDIGDMKSDMQQLADAIHDINVGVGELGDGISQLNDGTKQLSSGSADYLAGINQLDQSSSELIKGSKEIQDGLQQLSNAMQGGFDLPDMGDMAELPQGLHMMADGLRESAEGIEELSGGYDQAYGALSGAIEGIPEGDIEKEQFGELFQSNANQAVVGKLVETYEAAQIVKGTYKAVEDAFTGVTDALKDIPNGLYQMAVQLDAMAKGMESALEGLGQLNALADLQTGLSTLASEYGTFHKGLVGYTDGVHTLAVNYKELDNGIKGVSGGIAELDNGANQLHEGTSELASSTSNIPEDMQSQMDELMAAYENKDFEPISFVSNKNAKVDVVQFVLQTESIEIEETTEIVVENEPKKNVWERFLDLFR